MRDAAGNIEELDSSHDVPLAVGCDQEYSEGSRMLLPGDTVVLVTDGIAEARTDITNMFGMEGVANFLRTNRETRVEDIPSKLLEVARSHAEGRLQDDAAIVAFTCEDVVSPF